MIFKFQISRAKPNVMQKLNSIAKKAKNNVNIDDAVEKALSGILFQFFI